MLKTNTIIDNKLLLCLITCLIVLCISLCCLTKNQSLGNTVPLPREAKTRGFTTIQHCKTGIGRTENRYDRSCVIQQ